MTPTILALLLAAGLPVPPQASQLPPWYHWLFEAFRPAGGGSGTILTVTGISPLALVNSLAHSIASLTQYGKCVQNGTPTPVAPVDIMCNNGVLRMVDDELPDTYKRVLGFSCDNNALWEITGFKLKGSDTVRISFSVNAGCNVFGCYQGTDATDNYDLYVSTSYNAKYLRYGGGTYLSAWAAADLGKRFDVVYTPYGSQGMPQDSTWSPLTFTSANDLLIGSTTLTGASSKLKGNLYGSIVVDGRLKLIPCERLSDNVLGYYDTFSETFYEPYTDFTGAVSLGYDGSHYHLQVVGTPEVLTARGINLLNPSTSNITIGELVNAQGQTVTVANNWRTDYIPIVGGKTYIFYGRRKSDDVISAYCRMNFYESDKTPITPRPSYTQNTVTVGTAPSNAAYAMLSCAPLNSSNPITRDTFDEYNWMFAETAQEIPFEPYVQPQTVSVPMLLGVGDYKDEAEIISGIKTGKVGIKVFDGTETFTVSSSGAMITAISDVAVGAQNTPMNTHFALETSPTSIAVGTQRFGASGTVIYSANYYMKHTTITTVADFKAWLASEYANGTPVIVIYPRTNEQTEQTTPHSLHSYNGTTIVTAQTNVDPVTLRVEYKGVST